MTDRCCIQIILDPKRGSIGIPENPSPEQVDLIWACLRHFRTGEPLSFNSAPELIAYAEAERDYSRQRR